FENSTILTHQDILDLLENSSATISGTTGSDVLIGDSSSQTLDGSSGSDLLFAGGGNDSLLGGDSNDTLDGGTGDDTLIGGNGTDHYFIDSTNDVIVENAGQGTDQVFSSASYTLSSNVEYLTLTGNANIDGIGSIDNNK